MKKMKKMKKGLFLSIIIFICFGCLQKRPPSSLKTYYIEKILDKKSENLSIDSISSDITIIHLDTSDSILIDKIRSVYLYNQLLFVLHNKRCSVFDLKGKYLYDIGKIGQGPGEFSSIRNIYFYNKEIFIYDGLMNYIFHYTISGQFISRIPILDYMFDFSFIDKDIFVGFLIPNELASNRMKFYNTEGICVDSISHDRTFGNPEASIYSSDGHFFSYNDNKYIKEGYNDTTFLITPKHTLSPQYIIDVGKYARTYEDRILYKEKYSTGRAINVRFENDKYIILYGMGLKKGEYVLINKQQEYISKVNFIYNDEDLKLFLKEEEYYSLTSHSGFTLTTPNAEPIMIDDGSPSFAIVGVSEDNKVLIGYEKSLSLADNPVIVLVSVKDDL